MPQLRDVTVHVTDFAGNELQEWGAQTLRGNKVSTYIKSTPDMPFRVSVQPRIPYPNGPLLEGASRRCIKGEDVDDVCIKQEDSEEDTYGLPSHPQQKTPNHRYNPHEQHSAKTENYLRDNASYPQTGRQRQEIGRPASLPTNKGRRSLQVAAPPFSFLASLYLDGRKKPERRIVVYLDPNDDDFNRPSGQVKFKCRCVQGRDGFLKEQAWIFRDVGIETIFEKIALHDDATELQDPEDVLVDALCTSKLSGEHTEATEERGKVGQIVVELSRITLGKTFKERNYRAKHYEGDEDDMHTEGLSQDVAHTTAFKHLRTLKPEPIRCIEFEPYVNGEAPWATFQFFYRSQEQLQRFHFPGFPQNRLKRSRDSRRIDDVLAWMTPLSITHALRTAPVSTKRSKITFEERIRAGSAELEDAEHKYEFYDYREGPDNVVRTIPGGASNSAMVSAIRPRDINRTKGSRSRVSPSTIVAVKERACRRSRTMAGAGRSSTSSSPSFDGSPASPPRSPSVQPAATSPTTGFYNPTADPRLIVPNESQTDTFKAYSNTPEVLAGSAELIRQNQWPSKSIIKDMKYRRSSYDNDANDADAEWTDTTGGEASGDSDKENMPLTDRDDAGLHQRMNAVSLGTKRHRGEGMEELEEGEIDEDEEAQTKKKIPLADHATTRPIALERRLRR
ncbi:MAG: hypothetical protein Q9170_000176 [Blastenia crenularia]